MDKSTIILFADLSQALARCEEETLDIVEATVDLGQTSVPLWVGANNQPTRLSEIVPLARAVSDTVCRALIDSSAGDGQPVQCRKGCSDCCSYLVPLSIPEVFRLWEELSAMGEDAASGVLNRCFACEEKILDASTLGKLCIGDSFEAPKISRWYAQLQMSCPFLSHGLCRIYQQRPLACREHLVTSAAALCKSSPENTPQTLDMPVSTLEALGQLAAELEQSEVEAVMLPLAFTGIENGLDRSRRTWPAIQLVERFLGILNNTTVATMRAGRPCSHYAAPLRNSAIVGKPWG